ncbi:hypothetical protein Tco_0069350 [Tanacetum coccineum]
MHTRASNFELVKPLPEPERTLNRRLRRRNKRVPFNQRNNPPQNPRVVYPPILDILEMEEDSKHSYSNDDTCFSIEEDFNALLNEGSKILHFIKGTILEKEIFTEFNEFMAMTANENSNSESDIEELPFEKITINTDYKIKTSLKEPPTDLELKPLFDNLNTYSWKNLLFFPL